METIAALRTLNHYSKYFVAEYDNFPHGQYISLLLIRKTESETIFRTEGSGEGLVKETVIAGLQTTRRIRRVMISKRKQTAVERRAGREILRAYDMLKKDSKGQICALNTNAPCGKCIDCMVYGYAVGGGGAQRSRVMTDDSYSIAPAPQVTNRRTFNATFDNSTMRNPLNGKASTSINEDEYVLPETHFLDIETLKDVTIGEFQYIIGNILRSSRYGAISSRLGRVHNTLAGIIFSDTELFSNLELTQAVYDIMLGNSDELEVPLIEQEVVRAVGEAIPLLMKRLVSREPVIVPEAQLQSIIEETKTLYRDEDNVRELLTLIDKDYNPIHETK